MKFSEKKELRRITEIPYWPRSCFRSDMDPREADKIYEFCRELYEAAMAHPDWGSNGDKAFCLDDQSPQNTAKKLRKWFRAKRRAAP